MSEIQELINFTGRALLAEEGTQVLGSALRQYLGLAGYTASVFALGHLSARTKLFSRLIGSSSKSTPSVNSPLPVQRSVSCDDLLAEIKNEIDSHSDAASRMSEHLDSEDHDLIRDQAKIIRAENSQFQTFLDDRCVQLESHADTLRGALTRITQGLAGHRQRATELDGALAKFEDSDQIESAITPLRACIQQLQTDNQRLQAELAQTRQAVSQQSQKLEQAHEEARVDALTGLSNRRAFDEQIQQLHSRFVLENEPYLVAIFDVDHFKKFNDEHGHATGDKVLEFVSKVLRSTQRISDHVARIGGEEFAMLLPCLSGDQGKVVIDRHREKIEKSSLLLDGENLRITVSAGVAEIRPGDTIEAVIARADEALYAAKDAGRNQTCLEDDGEIVYFDQFRLPEPTAVV